MRVKRSFLTASAKVIMWNIFTFWQMVKRLVEVDGLTQGERKTAGITEGPVSKNIINMQGKCENYTEIASMGRRNNSGVFLILSSLISERL